MELCQVINHRETALRCTAERACLRGLMGGCQIAMGVSSHRVPGTESLSLTATILSRDGQTEIKETAVGDIGDAVNLGKEVATRLIAQGAGPILGTLGTERALTYGCAEERAD